MNSFRTAAFGTPGVVRVQGNSMEPKYQDGDWLLVTWFKGKKVRAISQSESTPFKKVRVTDVVVAEREEQPGIFYIKRVGKIVDNRYWLSSDNSEGTDSRTWGWLTSSEIRGKVIFLYYRKSSRASG